MARILVFFSLWVTVLGGFVEVLVMYVRKRREPLLMLSGDFVWMAPLALLALVGTIVTVTFLVGRVWKKGTVAALGLFVSATIVGLDLLILVPGLAHYAAVLVAAGLAFQLTRIVLAHPMAAGRLMRRSTLALTVCFLVVGSLMWTSLRPAAGRPPASAAPAGAPNVLLITLDTVRATNLSVYGYSRATTPSLERFVRRGVVFEQAQSTSPWTLPSHASIMTGRWPHELSTTATTPLDDSQPTLAEYFLARGYHTAGFVANMKYCGASTGLNRGFEDYEDYPRSLGEIASASTLVRTVANNFRLRKFIQNDQHLDRVSAPDLNARALAWQSAHAGSPFFMFLNYFEGHEPYLPPPPFDRAFGPGRALGRHSPLHHWLWNPVVDHQPMSEAVGQEEIEAYDGSLAYLDRYLGELFDELDRRGVLDNTIVVITADHGEEFAEHGVYEHGYSLYRSGVHVPLMVVAPGRAPEGRRVPTPISIRDLAATIVDVAGLDREAPFPGRSLAQLWREDASASAAEARGTSPLFQTLRYWEGQPDWFPSSKGDMSAIVYDGMRYIRNGDGREELYDFAHDPWERTNLVARPEQALALAGVRAAVERLLNSSAR